MVFGAIKMRKRIAFAVNGFLLQCRIGFTPCDRCRVHFKDFCNFNFNGWIRCSHFNTRQIVYCFHRLYRHKMPITVFRPHDRLKTDFICDIFHIISQRTVIDSGIKILLILRRRDVRQIKYLEHRRKTCHIRSWTDSHFNGSALSGFHQYAVTA